MLVMTRAGRARFARADAVYTAALREHFGRHLSRGAGPCAGGRARAGRARTRDSRRARSRTVRTAMIKYIGSKRRLVPVLGELAAALGARRALDLFTGTTRVAQELKRRGMHVTAVDSARYAEVFARCYVETDAAAVDTRRARRRAARSRGAARRRRLRHRDVLRAVALLPAVQRPPDRRDPRRDRGRLLRDRRCIRCCSRA